MNKPLFVLDDDFDASVDEQISECLNLDSPKSFFLFAGAGSGKTRSLVKALEKIKNSFGKQLRLRGQKVGVITYTNNACDEITRRLKNDTLFSVSTIHSFIWDLIRGFNFDIKKWLQEDLEKEIDELESKKSREGTKAEINRIYKIKSKRERLEELPQIKKFTYNPNSNNTERESLSHTEVLQIGADFLKNKALMQTILIKKFPILFIDESQDTNKGLMEAFISVQEAHKDKLSLGLFGDIMQRIYSDGKEDLGRNLPDDWKKPAKRINHRSKERIITLINKIRSEVDTHTQFPCQDKQGGIVRFFVIQNNKDRQNTENEVMQQMATITGDNAWVAQENVATLILEHHMAARRMGFGEMFQALYPNEKFRTGLLDGTLPEIKIFSDIIFPILKAHKAGDQFAIANVVKKHSPVLNKAHIKAHKDTAQDILEKVKKTIEGLCNSYDNNPNITFGELLNIVSANNVFEIPRGYTPILKRESSESILEIEDNVDASTESSNDEIDCLDAFLNTEFFQIQKYVDYINEKSPFFTHQGVKGLEFPRVMAIIDDYEAKGFLFSYEKLFGIKSKTSADEKNERENKETGIDRTRRLFYVICSRAKESLAIVAYTEAPQILKTLLLEKEWFSSDEIIELN